MNPSFIHNGMPAASLGDEGWNKPWSDNGCSCLEAMKLPGGRVAIRQSTDPDSPALIFEPAEIRAFMNVKAGLADNLLDCLASQTLTQQNTHITMPQPDETIYNKQRVSARGQADDRAGNL